MATNFKEGFATFWIRFKALCVGIYMVFFYALLLWLVSITPLGMALGLDMTYRTSAYLVLFIGIGFISGGSFVGSVERRGFWKTAGYKTLHLLIAGALLLGYAAINFFFGETISAQVGRLIARI